MYEKYIYYFHCVLLYSLAYEFIFNVSTRASIYLFRMFYMITVRLTVILFCDADQTSDKYVNIKLFLYLCAF